MGLTDRDFYFIMKNKILSNNRIPTVECMMGMAREFFCILCGCFTHNPVHGHLMRTNER